MFDVDEPTPHTGPVRLEVDARGCGTITVGGVDISHAVSEVTIVSRVREANTVTCTGSARVEVGMPVLALLAEGADVKIRDEDQATLIALGWTPPEATA